MMKYRLKRFATLTNKDGQRKDLWPGQVVPAEVLGSREQIVEYFGQGVIAPAGPNEKDDLGPLKFAHDAVRGTAA